MRNSAQYHRYVSTHYDAIAPATLASFRKRYYVWRSYLTSLLPPARDSAILEIGCGVGHNLYALKELGYSHIEGTDYSSECVRICRNLGFSAHLVNDRTESAFYKKHEKSFDCIVLYDVVEHYSPADAKKLLQSVRTMLRKGGSVILSLPNAQHPFSNSLLFADTTHQCIYTPLSLSQLLKSCGFDRIELKQMNSWSLFDDNILLRMIKHTVLQLVALAGEMFWRIIAFSQGIILPECKPTLIALVRLV